MKVPETLYFYELHNLDWKSKNEVERTVKLDSLIYFGHEHEADVELPQRGAYRKRVEANVPTEGLKVAWLTSRQAISKHAGSVFIQDPRGFLIPFNASVVKALEGVTIVGGVLQGKFRYVWNNRTWIPVAVD